MQIYYVGPLIKVSKELLGKSRWVLIRLQFGDLSANFCRNLQESAGSEDNPGFWSRNLLISCKHSFFHYYEAHCAVPKVPSCSHIQGLARFYALSLKELFENDLSYWSPKAAKKICLDLSRETWCKLCNEKTFHRDTGKSLAAIFEIPNSRVKGQRDFQKIAGGANLEQL